LSKAVSSIKAHSQGGGGGGAVRVGRQNANVGGYNNQGFVDVLAAQQSPENPEWFQGTADAVRQYLWLFAETGAQEYLILSGDHLYRMDYEYFVAKHRECAADITVGAVPMDEERAAAFGLMKIDDTGRIIDFAEKPTGDELKAMMVSSLGDARSFLGDAKSSLADAESSLGDAKSSLGDAKSSLGDAKSSLGDAKSSLGDAESSLGDAKSSLGDAMQVDTTILGLDAKRAKEMPYIASMGIYIFNKSVRTLPGPHRRSTQQHTCQIMCLLLTRGEGPSHAPRGFVTSFTVANFPQPAPRVVVRSLAPRTCGTRLTHNAAGDGAAAY
jgi:NDP-sugar pyrophosphorylase family protein